jgi:NTE family protein
MDAQRRALVLGGGGVTGIAWELGLVQAWLEGGVDVRTADVAIGTSAGSAAGAQLWTSPDIDGLIARQLDPNTSERLPEMDLDVVIAIFTLAAERGLTHEERCARVGRMALDAPTVPEAVRREIVAARLRSPDWPERPLWITAVDAETGGFTLFDKTKGVELVDAVAASCAVPGIWPPVTIEGRRYVDGGVWSPVNAFLAEGFERVLVVSPFDLAVIPGVRGELDGLRAGGAEVLVIQGDDETSAAMGPNPLDPAMRAPSVAAGRRQGQATLADLRAFWDG